ncbi:MAG: peptide-methionine (S)-S-oxide reductase MsrA [Deltaproteobacteria bacterium]
MKTRFAAAGAVAVITGAAALVLFSGNLLSMIGSRPGREPATPATDGTTKNGGRAANDDNAGTSPAEPAPDGMQTATFGSGCFWCTEAVFQRLKGVESVVPGYSGGDVKNPTYREVCEGTTGHAEVIQVTYDPQVVSYADLLEVFWKLHDPTTLNRQGNDVGTQYRSVIFCHTDEQKELAEHYRRKLDESGIFPRPIVTEITRFSEFYPAEDYHQNYFREHGSAPYCRFVIGPKMEKLKEVFRDRLK